MGKEKVIQYAAKFISKIPKSTWKRFENSANSGLPVLSKAGDKEVITYIVKNNLITLDNLAKFMVEMQIEQMTAMYEGFYSVKQDYKIEWKAKLESAGYKFEYALNNPQKKEEELDEARRQVMDCISVFKNDIIKHIEKIRQIDNQSEAKFFLSSWPTLIKCQKESTFAIETIKRLLDAYKLLFTIASNTQDDISSLIDTFEKNKNEIMAKDNCLLMAAYCKHQTDKDFWYGLSDLWDEQKLFLSESVEVFGNEDKNEPSFWDNNIDDVDLSNIF